MPHREAADAGVMLSMTRFPGAYMPSPVVADLRTIPKTFVCVTFNPFGIACRFKTRRTGAETETSRSFCDEAVRGRVSKTVNSLSRGTV